MIGAGAGLSGGLFAGLFVGLCAWLLSGVSSRIGVCGDPAIGGVFGGPGIPCPCIGWAAGATCLHACGWLIGC